MTIPKTHQFREWLRRSIAALPPGSRLPYDRELAAEWGISPITVRRILTQLTHEGVVVRHKGMGTFIPGMPDIVVAAPEPPVSSTQSVIDYLTSAIATARLKTGETLPPYKFFIHTLNVSPRTVSLALKHLLAHGLVRRMGRHYIVGSRLPEILATGNRKVVFLLPAGVTATALFKSAEIELCLCKMENELVRNGFEPVFVNAMQISDRIRAWKAAGHVPFGIVLLGSRSDGTTTREDLITYDTALRPFLAMKSTPTVRTLCITRHDRSSIEGAMHFSMSHAHTVALRRLAVFSHEKGFRALTFFVALPEHAEARAAVLLNALRFTPEIEHANPHCRYSYVLSCPSTSISDRDIARLLKSPGVAWYATSRLSKYRSRSIEDVMKLLHSARSMTDGFEKAAHEGLWVFTSEAGAAQALDWCSLRRIAVPRKLSIIGLENNRSFYERQISSCVMDWDTMGYLMAHAVIGDMPLKKTSHGFIAYDALLLLRSTTSHR